MPGDAGQLEMKSYFWTHHGIPNCLGILDGTHVPVTCASGTSTAYYCYKGFTSINC